MEKKAEYITEAPLAISEQRETYVRSDGTTFVRSDIYVKLHVTFRDKMLSTLKGPPLSVYLCIALHCGKEEMTAYPSISTICKETGYSNRAVITAAQKLQSMGLIETVGVHKSGSNIYRVRGYVSMGKNGPYEPSSQVPVNLVHTPYEPSSHKEDTNKKIPIEETPPPADSPPAEEWPAEVVALGEDPAPEEDVDAIVEKYQQQLEKMRGRGLSEEEQELFRRMVQTPLFDDVAEVAETEAMFNKTKPSQPRSKEEHQAGVRRALERNAKNGNGRAGIADPTQDDTWLGPAREFSALIVTPNVPESKLRMWADDIKAIVDDSETGKGAAETSTLIRSIAMCKDYEWLRACNRPTHQGFVNALLAALWGQALPEREREGGSSTPRQEVNSSGHRRVPTRGAVR